MKSISIEELEAQGYSEDDKARKAFERPYRIPFILGIIVYGICFVLVVHAKMSADVGLLKVGLMGLGLSFLFLGGTGTVQRLSRPKSKLTGKPLEKYKNQSPDSGVLYEVIYVCADSKTFFRKVFAMRGSSSAGVGVGI